MDMKTVLKSLLATSLLTVSLIAATEARKGTLKGHTASVLFTDSGELVVIYKNSVAGLSEARQNPPSGEYTSKSLSAGVTLSTPVAKKDRTGSIWLLGEEERAGGTAITLSRLEQNGMTETQIVSGERGYHFSPDMAFDRKNDPWVTWVGYISGESAVYVKDVRSGEVWMISGPSPEGAFSPKIAADAANRIWAIWTENREGRDKIFYSRYHPPGWTGARQLDTVNPSPQILPDIGVDAAGNLWAAWSAFDGADYEIYCAFHGEDSWSKPEKVTQNSASDSQPDLYFAWGNVPVFVWNQIAGGYSRICLRYKIGGKWSPEFVIDKRHKASNMFPKVSIHGNKMAVVWQAKEEIHTRLLSFPLRQNRSTSGTGEIISKDPDSLWPDEDKYIGFGDSITFGMIDYMETPELGYIPRLESTLYKTFGPTQVVNEGWPGELTYQGLARIEDVLTAHNARYFLLMEGTNDVVFRHVSMETTVFNLEQMIQICRDNLVFPVLTTIIPRNDKRWAKEFFRERIFFLNDLIRDLAVRTEVSFIDMFDIFYNWPEDDGGWTSLLSNDDVHPSIKGYEVMADSWFDEIRLIPFPPVNIKTARLTERSMGAVQTGNHVTWSHSPKLSDLDHFRAYKIFRTGIDASPSTFELIKTLILKEPQACISGSIIFPIRNCFGRSYVDFDIDATQKYKYVLMLIRKDGVTGPNSKIARDKAQGGTDQ